jgi:GNAT superfamily N-acetyltransferase
MASLTCRRWSPEDNLKEFSSGIPELDQDFRDHATKGDQTRSSSTFVAVRGEDEIVGFITVTAGWIFGTDVTDEVPTCPHGQPVLVVLWLGVHHKFHRQSIGTELMLTAFEQVAHMKAMPGCIGIYLDAFPRAIDFYKSLLFQPRPSSNPEVRPMFLERGLAEKTLALRAQAG